jgi:hypothetical protein
MNKFCDLNVFGAFEGTPMMSVTPQEMVYAVATLLRMPMSTVKNFDRKLMEAGLRTKKGHGRGSAIMNSDDAAILLVAIASSDEISLAAQCATTVREIPFARKSDQRMIHNKEVDRLNSAAMSSLCDITGSKPSDCATFGGAIDAIMKHLVEQERDYLFFFEIEAISGVPLAAKIGINSKKNHETIDFYRRGTIKQHISSGLHVRRMVPGSTLHRVASLIGGRKYRSPAWVVAEAVDLGIPLGKADALDRAD